MKVLVYGAGGSQQFPVIKALRDKGANVVATTHQPHKVRMLNDAGAEAVIADMADPRRLSEISKGINAVAFLVPFFLPSPQDGLQYARNVIDAAVENSVELLVWNTSGFIPAAKIGIPYIDVRIDIADYLKKSGLPHILIEPSVYAENLLGPWTAPFVEAERVVTYPTPERMPVGWIATADVAAFVAEAVYSPHLAGHSYRVSGVENLTGDQLARKFSIGLNMPLQYRQMPPREFGAILAKLFGDGAGKDTEAMYEEITQTGNYPIMYNPAMQDVLQKLPVNMTPIEDWVRQNFKTKGI
jgi:uncharacterized protein YbjT (DUF2867 family)